MRESRAESRAARALIRTMLDDIAAEVPEIAETPDPPAIDPEPFRDLEAVRDVEALRDLERWALLVALACLGLVLLGALDRC